MPCHALPSYLRYFRGQQFWGDDGPFLGLADLNVGKSLVATSLFGWLRAKT